MAKISFLNIFDDLVRTSDVLTAGIEKGINVLASMNRWSACFMFEMLWIWDFVLEWYKHFFAWHKHLLCLRLPFVLFAKYLEGCPCSNRSTINHYQSQFASWSFQYIFFLLEFIAFVSHQENCRQQWCLEQDELTKLRKENAKLKVLLWKVELIWKSCLRLLSIEHIKTCSILLVNLIFKKKIPKYSTFQFQR